MRLPHLIGASILFVVGHASWTSRRRYVVQAVTAVDGELVAEIHIERHVGCGVWTRGRGGMLIRVNAIDEVCALLQRVKVRAGAAGGTH